MFKSTPISKMTDAFAVSGKNVVITGGNRGIGKGISLAFAQSGANVVILCRHHESGLEAVEALDPYGGKNACFKCDVSDMTSVKAAVKEVFGFYDHKVPCRRTGRRRHPGQLHRSGPHAFRP